MIIKVEKSRSRNVNGYVQAKLRHHRLQSRLTMKLRALEPLQRDVERARIQAHVKYGKLRGAQITEATRLLAPLAEELRA